MKGPKDSDIVFLLDHLSVESRNIVGPFFSNDLFVAKRWQQIFVGYYRASRDPNNEYDLAAITRFALGYGPTEQQLRLVLTAYAPLSQKDGLIIWGEVVKRTFRVKAINPSGRLYANVIDALQQLGISNAKIISVVFDTCARYVYPDFVRRSQIIAGLAKFEITPTPAQTAKLVFEALA
jgi:hypothetical protein